MSAYLFGGVMPLIVDTTPSARVEWEPLTEEVNAMCRCGERNIPAPVPPPPPPPPPPPEGNTPTTSD